MKVGIVIDNYKISTFRRVLAEEGFGDFTEHEGITPTTMLLKVVVDDEGGGPPRDLTRAILKANTEAAKVRVQ